MNGNNFKNYAEERTVSHQRLGVYLNYCFGRREVQGKVMLLGEAETEELRGQRMGTSDPGGLG